MKIHIRDLTTYATIGVHDWEQKTLRPLIINLSLTLIHDKATKSDALEDTVDYDTLSQTIITTLASKPYQLIETVAQDIIDLALAHTLVEHVAVTVDKPGAVTEARSVAVSLEQSRP